MIVIPNDVEMYINIPIPPSYPSDGAVQAVVLTPVSVVLIILDNKICICSNRARKSVHLRWFRHVIAISTHSRKTFSLMTNEY